MGRKPKNPEQYQQPAQPQAKIKLTTDEVRRLRSMLLEVNKQVGDADDLLAEGEVTHDTYHRAIATLTRGTIMRAAITSLISLNEPDAGKEGEPA